MIEQNSNWDFLQNLKAEMGPDERIALAALMRDDYTGEGEACDFGSSIGGSTVCMAAGLKDNKTVSAAHKLKRIHAFDLFEQTFLSFKGMPVIPPNGLTVFHKQTQNFKEFIEVYKGDIQKMAWNKPIEIAHIDMAKILPVWQALSKILFKYYKPGLTWMLHQDFERLRLPWLRYSTMAMIDYLDVRPKLHDGTLYAKITKEIPQELSDKIEQDNFTMEEKLNLCSEMSNYLDENIKDSEPWRFYLGQPYCQFWFGDKAKAFEEAQTNIEDYAKLGALAYIKDLFIDSPIETGLTQEAQTSIDTLAASEHLEPLVRAKLYIFLANTLAAHGHMDDAEKTLHKARGVNGTDTLKTMRFALQTSTRSTKPLSVPGRVCALLTRPYSHMIMRVFLGASNASKAA